jgi:hypothetical protein
MTGITCHWVDKSFTLHDALLDFKRIKGRHVGRSLSTAVYNVLNEFDLCDKLFCITSDNASNNYTMLDALSNLLWDERSIDWKGREHHIACLNHVINLCVQDFLKGLAEKDEGKKKRRVAVDDEVEVIEEAQEEGEEEEDAESEEEEQEVEEEEPEEEEEEDNDDQPKGGKNKGKGGKGKRKGNELRNDPDNPKLAITLEKVRSLCKVYLSSTCLCNV